MSTDRATLRSLISQGLIPSSSAVNKLSEAVSNTPQLAAEKFICNEERTELLFMVVFCK